MASHISELADKSARSILGSTLKEDGYHENIMLAAGELVAAGMPDYVFFVEWFNSTVWLNDDGSTMVWIDDYGRILMKGRYNG